MTAEYVDIRKGLRKAVLQDGTQLYIQETGIPAQPYRCWTVVDDKMSVPFYTSTITEAEASVADTAADA